MKAKTTVSLTAVPTAVGPPPDVQSLVAGDQARRQAEQQSLHQRDDHLRQAGQQRHARDERAGRDVLDEHDEEVAPGEPDDGDDRIEHQRNECRGEHPRHHQRLDGVDADHLHRVDLLADRPRAEVRAHRGGTGAGDDDRGDDGSDLGDRCQRGASSGQVTRADLDEHDVEREDDEDGVGNRQHQRRNDRHPGHEPDLIEQLAPCERPSERRREGLAGHHHEVAHCERRLRPSSSHGRRPRFPIRQAGADNR